MVCLCWFSSIRHMISVVPINRLAASADKARHWPHSNNSQSSSAQAYAWITSDL